MLTIIVERTADMEEEEAPLAIVVTELLHQTPVGTLALAEVAVRLSTM